MTEKFNIKPGKDFELILSTQSTPVVLKMKWVEPTTIVMGINDPQNSFGSFEAQISTGYWIAQNLTTSGQWNLICVDNQKESDNPELPVVNVSWDEADTFCSLMNINYAASIPHGYTFRLPTEVEWERICQLITISKQSELLDYAWCKENSNDTLQPVGQKKPNSMNIYDILGNASEWCYDSFEEYPNNKEKDWYGRGSYYCKSLRGSSYRNSVYDESNSASYRGYWRNTFKSQFVSFRLCLGSTISNQQ